jgi:hypothetical protein
MGRARQCSVLPDFPKNEILQSDPTSRWTHDESWKAARIHYFAHITKEPNQQVNSPAGNDTKNKCAPESRSSV